MASKCKQPKATKCVLALAAQTVLHLEHLALFYTFTGATKDLELLLNSGLTANTRVRDIPEGPTLLHLAAALGNTQIVLLLLRLGADKSIVAGLTGTPLHQAAVNGHVSTVKRLLMAGCPVDVVGSNGSNVLHYAAQGGNAEVIRVVLSAGCDINATSSDGGTPLHSAARSGNTETALELIRHGANKAIVSGSIGTPLHQAAGHGHVSTVKAMIKAGCPLDVVGSTEASVLHAAAISDNAEVISVVLSTGCDINATDREGGTPLHWAAKNGSTETALELLRHGANKAIVAGLVGTPLHLAVEHGHVSTVKAMIKAGCPVDVVASNGATVLHHAAIKDGGNAEVISVVLSTGCDINATDSDGGTPLHIAAMNGNTETALELLRHGANKAIVAGLVGTPLHLAVEHGHVSTVKAMIKAGCPVDVVASNGATVLHHAAIKDGGNAEVISVVLSTGCDINATDSDGGTPLHIAAMNGNTETALELLRHGANKVIVSDLAGTPLHQAAEHGHVSTVKAMIKAGCPVDVVASNGATVLHHAAIKDGGNAEVISVVLSTGCDINATDNKGGTPLHIAAMNGNTETALELLRHGANKVIVSDLAGTPLHQAAGRGHVSTVKAMIKAGCPVDVVTSNGASVLDCAAAKGNAEVIRELLSAGCDLKLTDNDVWLPLNLAATFGKSEALQELIRCEMAQKGGVKSIHADVHGWTPLHHAVFSQSKECVRILLEHGADSMKASPYVGSPYNYAVNFAPAVVEAFDNFIAEEDESLPWMHVLRDPLFSRYVPKQWLRRSFLEKDPLGMSQLEYTVIVFQFPDELVLLLYELSLVSRDNLLLLAAIHGLCTLLQNLTHGTATHPSFTTYTVTSLVNYNYYLMEFYRSEKVPQYHKLVPPDSTLNLLHVALLSLKGRTSRVATIESIKGDYSSLLKLLVTSDSFRHTLHEYLPNGLTPLDLAEKLGLGEAVSIISSAGGRHGIYTLSSEEVRLQHGPTMLLVHQELMKLASSGALGQQALQAVLSQLPGKTTVEQGTATDESYICQEKLLGQRPDLSVIIKTILPKVDFGNWEETGVLLQVPTSSLEHLEHNHFKLRDKYRKVLQYWLDHDEAASWKVLLEVLSHFETKQTVDQLTQELLATQVGDCKYVYTYACTFSYLQIQMCYAM